VPIPNHMNDPYTSDERRYREHFLRHDVRNFSVFTGFFIILFLLLIMADYAFWKNVWIFYGLLALRISLSALALGAIIKSLKTTNPAAFDRWALAFALYLVVTNNLVILSRPAGYLHSMMAEMVCIVTLYAVMPDRILYRIAPPVIMTIGSLACFFTVKEPVGFVPSLSIVLAFIVANIMGIGISSAYYTFRRTSFFAAEEIESLYRKTRDSEKQHHLLVQNSHGIIYTIEPNGSFGFVSPSWTKLLGHDTSEVIGRDFRNFVHRDDIPACVAFLTKTVETGEVQEGAAYRVLHIDGSYRWHRSNIVPCFNDKNEIVSFVGNAVDITEHVHYEAELEQARIAAEEANKAKSEFLALVSHEIRTPLNAIVGFSSLAGKTSSPQVLQDYLAMIENQARSLTALINDILDMSKIEANGMDLETIPVNVRQLLDALAAHYRLKAVGKPVDFIFRLDNDIPEWVMADPLRLHQILSNLLDNAFKFTEKGNVALEVDMIDKPRDNSAGTIRFTVHDTGIGIPEDKRSQLFEPFRQLDPGITRKYGGTGLGLAIVRRLALLMAGKITVASREGAGSSFVVELPLPLATTPPEISKPEIDASYVPLSVLVVEDNHANRRLMEDTLASWGHRVTMAADGAEALEHVALAPFDVILTDLRMPGMDGMETTSRIRLLEKEAGRPRTPVIAVTADAETNTGKACLAAGIDAILTKPVPMDKLAAIMAELTCVTPIMAQGKTAPDNRRLLSPLIDQTLNDMGYDVTRSSEFTKLLLIDIEEETAHLMTSLQSQNRGALEQAAHTLKGLCSHLHDALPKDLSTSLHTRAHSAALPKLQETADLLQEAVNRIITDNRVQEGL
jgi:PAS domain S-box-containing protein